MNVHDLGNTHFANSVTVCGLTYSWITFVI